MTNTYAWCDIVDGDAPLAQGDFVDSCPVIKPPLSIKLEKELSVKADVEVYDVVVMSQSCDLLARKISLILLCPVWPFSEFAKQGSIFDSKKGQDILRQGNAPGYHLLNRCDIDGFTRDYMVADFRTVYSVHMQFLEEHAKTLGKRRRLLPPYREHLSQAFARFFMRVGLPIDIPESWWEA
jgi:hypothetical protein